MKKIILTACISAFMLTSCKTESKKEITTPVKTKKTTEKKAAYILQNATNTINWTAYKTTEKKPVNGIFKTVKITNNGTGNTIKEAIHNSKFSIPVSSIFTKDSGRDFKLKKFFFGAMEKTELLDGTLVLENDSLGYANITMNGITNKLPLKYNIKGKVFSASTTMKISDWKAEKALNSLNEACKDLHKGEDGVSKTWNEVAINISSIFN